jgi:hypothetical protein
MPIPVDISDGILARFEAHTRTGAGGGVAIPKATDRCRAGQISVSGVAVATFASAASRCPRPGRPVCEAQVAALFLDRRVHGSSRRPKP